MTGQQMEALRDALCAAFDLDALDQMLRFRLDKDRSQITGPGSLSTVTFKVIEVAIREGWQGDLIRAARAYNSGNRLLRKFCEDHPETGGQPSGPGSSAALVEYLFVDRPRLRNYAEQFHPHEVRDSELTVHESVVRLYDHLQRGRLAVTHRPLDPFEPEVETHRFRIETMAARRAYIPPRRSEQETVERSGLRLWVSLRPDGLVKARSPAEQVGALFLIEDLTDPKQVVLTASGCSSLMFLAAALLRSGSSVVEVGVELNALHREEGVRRRFAQDPVGTLTALGAQFGAERRIKALYRLRACCVESEMSPMAVTTVGYPIVIQEAG